jgi:hypothetical protein
MSRTWLLLVAIFIFPLFVGGQSLGEVAKKEKKRREANKEKGVEVRVVSEDEISTEGEENDDAALVAGPKETDGGSDDALAPTVRSVRDRDPGSTSASDRQREEALWRSRFSEARARLNAAQERYDALKDLHLVPGEYYVDENGRPLIRSLAELRRMTEKAEAELNDAKKSLEDLREDARRAGIPPGWLR